MPKKNVAICVPSGRFVDFSFFKSFANNIGQLMLAYNCAVFTVSSPYITENRNEILRKVFAFEQQNPGFKFDFLLWLDTDHVFNFNQIQKLFSHLDQGKDFVSGTYFNPIDNEIKPVAYHARGEKFEWLEEKDLKGLMEVDAIGFGFCAMKREVFEKVFEKFKPRPFDMRYLENGSVITEDMVFCERAKSLGFKIWLDSELIVKHAKGFLPR